MDYKEYNDYELLDYISENNSDANEILYNKYIPLINSIAKSLYKYCKNQGLELNDLCQEGLLGLNYAIKTFDDTKDNTFYTYARTCIKRKNYK